MLFVMAGAALLVGGGSCARTDLNPDELEFTEIPVEDADVPDVDADPDAEPDAPIDARPDVEVDACVPVGDEECNGLDDDCNGDIDDLPPIPCPEGGNRYCVDGRLSECPRSCDVCVPGQVRVCFVSFCYYWGTQTCQGDGRSFGNCDESARPPPGCEAVAKRHQNSPQLEQCCIDQGYCCLDQHDLDRDGDRTDHLGACEDVVCID